MKNHIQAESKIGAEKLINTLTKEELIELVANGIIVNMEYKVMMDMSSTLEGGNFPRFLETLKRCHENWFTIVFKQK